MPLPDYLAASPVFEHPPEPIRAVDSFCLKARAGDNPQPYLCSTLTESFGSVLIHLGELWLKYERKGCSVRASVSPNHYGFVAERNGEFIYAVEIVGVYP